MRLTVRKAMKMRKLLMEFVNPSETKDPSWCICKKYPDGDNYITDSSEKAMSCLRWIPPGEYDDDDNIWYRTDNSRWMGFLGRFKYFYEAIHEAEPEEMHWAAMHDKLTILSESISKIEEQIKTSEQK